MKHLTRTGDRMCQAETAIVRARGIDESFKFWPAYVGTLRIRRNTLAMP